MTTAMAWTALALACLSITACRSSEEVPVRDATPPASGKSAVSTGFAPAGEPLRTGTWQGGPDPVSGKLRSGISTYYQMHPTKPKGGQTVKLRLRFEDVVGEDAAVKLKLGDGALWAQPSNDPTGDNDTPSWRLTPNQAAEVTVNIKLPVGDSYLHVMSAQNKRPSVTSILLSAMP